MMWCRSRWPRVLGTVAVLVALTATAAFALYRQLSTDLSGPAIGGVVPKGSAKVDQSKLPQEPGKLEAKVENVNLPNGTALDVILTDAGSAPVGTIFLSSGRGQLSTNLPDGVGIGRTSSIFVKLGTTTILSGGSPWKV